MTKQEAIKQAESQFGPLVEIAPGGWGFSVWSDRLEKWLPPGRAENYEAAENKRAAGITAIAAQMLLDHQDDPEVDPEEIVWRIVELAYNPDNTGSVESRLERTLEGFGHRSI